MVIVEEGQALLRSTIMEESQDAERQEARVTMENIPLTPESSEASEASASGIINENAK